MQADVFPVPTAPRIMTPVYKPRWGMVSQVGTGDRPGLVGKWDSPSTSDGVERSSGTGKAGRCRDATVTPRLEASMARSDPSIEARKNGVLNQSDAYP